MTINEELIVQLVRGGEANEIVDDDVIAFIANPRLWRPVPKPLTLELETAQAFWQGVYDELGIKVEVPPVPKLTGKQVKSFKKFGFLLVYVPGITEEQYPKGFVKPWWGQCLTVSEMERLPLKSQWVAVETIAKPHYEDLNGYAVDVLMTAVKCEKRFTVSHDDITDELLAKIAKTTGFPKKGTRLPTAEEWNLIGNLFNWLREHRRMDLPNLGSTRSLEWCANAYRYGRRLLVGDASLGGLASVGCDPHARRNVVVAFRILAVL